ncbi:MAG TPA: bifunctional DNA-formamidopyrimidine glycosylase/DNA-(apurinic or apyrimidinic site) lyase [Thermomicrobiales bacterium]|nr:bifunctional DNA-formamidopyrimidine glycosylase/DNA-(apurinic or apyrimidinic site) lyase [Thermomicrobiales bacterium]
MPELPEVETARRYLERGILGQSVSAIDVRLPKLLRDSPLPSLELLLNHTVVAVGRRAKVLILAFDHDLTLLVHLKLAGQVAVFLSSGERLVAGHPVPAPFGEYPHKVTHIEFHFAEGTVVYFSDVRQFGWFRLMPTSDVEAAIDAFAFGPEGTGALDVDALSAIISRRSIPIKTLLLDQSFIAGLGNIYVDEVLFRSNIHPATAARDLSDTERKTMLGHVPAVLAEGIRQGGAKIIHNIAHPVDQFPAVHGRGGEPCFVCETTIEKIRVGSRGTYFCPNCQPPTH